MARRIDLGVVRLSFTGASMSMGIAVSRCSNFDKSTLLH